MVTRHLSGAMALMLVRIPYLRHVLAVEGDTSRSQQASRVIPYSGIFTARPATREPIKFNEGNPLFIASTADTSTEEGTPLTFAGHVPGINPAMASGGAPHYAMYEQRKG